MDISLHFFGINVRSAVAGSYRVCLILKDEAVHACHVCLTLFWRFCTGQLVQKNKGMQIGKEEVKLSLVTDAVDSCIEHSKESTKKLLGPISGFSSTVGYRIDT